MRLRLTPRLLLAPFEVFTKRRREPLVPHGRLLRLAGLRHIDPFKACRVPRRNRLFERRACARKGAMARIAALRQPIFERRLLP
jgi:hypothetical protein